MYAVGELQMLENIELELGNKPILSMNSSYFLGSMVKINNSFVFCQFLLFEEDKKRIQTPKKLNNCDKVSIKCNINKQKVKYPF